MVRGAEHFYFNPLYKPAAYLDIRGILHAKELIQEREE